MSVPGKYTLHYSSPQWALNYWPDLTTFNGPFSLSSVVRDADKVEETEKGETEESKMQIVKGYYFNMGVWSLFTVE